MADIQTIESAETANEAARAELIAQQNDLFRTSWGMDASIQGQIVMTQGVSALPPEARNAIGVSVIAFSEFTEENDPHQDHTFGSIKVDVEGVETTLFWKIDLYDTDYKGGSEDPANLNATRRVLTIMQPHEY